MYTIVANFKMNKTSTQIKDYIMKILPRVDGKSELILALPSTSLSLAKFLLEGSEIKVCGQNLCDEEAGKNTGEVSGAMIKECGCDYVIVGHSDRRIKYKETGRTINKKIKIALKNRLKVIICVGESMSDKNSKKTNESLKSQVCEALKGLYENELENIIIAYEPVWAIGSGKLPLAKEIESAVKTIRKTIASDFSDKAGENTKVIYGGSIDNKNSNSIIKVKGINGLLVGGACLDPISFSQLIKELK